MRFLPPYCQLLAVVAAICRAQVAVQTGMTADAHCGQGYCFTAIYSPQQSAINYTLVVPKGGADSGWYGVAQGTKMKGANMAINWVNTDGSLTTSHRSAPGEQYPTEDLASSLPSLTINDGIIASTASQTIWSWSFAQPSAPSSKMSHIFASSSGSPKGQASSSGIPMHDHYEYPITLDMTKPYDGSAPAGLISNGASSMQTTQPSSSAVSSRHRDLSKNVTRLFFVHMLLMVVAWLLVLPIGIYIARYGRTFFTWFPAHRGVQLFGTVLILVAAILAIAAIHSISGEHFSSDHAKSGLGVFIILNVQVLLGGFAHYYKGKTGKRYIGYVHMPLGILLLAFSVYTIHLGLNIWRWEPPKAFSYFVYAWAGFLLFVYIAGFAMCPREREHDSRQDIEMKQLQ